jgi:S1-C subfamily serine protease
MLAESPFTNRTAGDREAGARCPHCAGTIAFGEDIAACARCGAVHHVVCWQTKDGCGTFDCAPGRRILAENRPPELRVTADDVANVKPPPRPVVVPAAYFLDRSAPAANSKKWSRLSIAALAVAVAGPGLAVLAIGGTGIVSALAMVGGILFGIVAVLLSSLALSGIHRSRKRGMWLAVAGVPLGLASTIGWICFAAYSAGLGGHLGISLDEFEPDLDALNHMAGAVARSARANVLVETKFGSGLLGGTGIGSGVILQIEHGSALIVTNRHVVDPKFAGQDSHDAKGGLPDSHLQVKLVGQSAHPGQVVWIAPEGVDLALIRVDVDGTGANAADWKPKTKLEIGSEVFTMGNPQHLDWTLTDGKISNLWYQHCGSRQVHVIQISAALNPGNSGGGLYDKSGALIGINTWTNDKRYSEGLGFAISLDSLLDLNPPEVHVAGDPPAEKE